MCVCVCVQVVKRSFQFHFGIIFWFSFDFFDSFSSPIGAKTKERADRRTAAGTQVNGQGGSSRCVHVTHVIDFDSCDRQRRKRKVQTLQQKLVEASGRPSAGQCQQSGRFVDESHFDRFMSMASQHQSVVYRHDRVNAHLIVMNCLPTISNEWTKANERLNSQFRERTTKRRFSFGLDEHSSMRRDRSEPIDAGPSDLLFIADQSAALIGARGTSTAQKCFVRWALVRDRLTVRILVIKRQQQSNRSKVTARKSRDGRYGWCEICSNRLARRKKKLRQIRWNVKCLPSGLNMADACGKQCGWNRPPFKYTSKCPTGDAVPK